ncbi:MAG TPA: TIGR02391 family protein [Candidatus Cloacimonadota bacterium]|nr:TIGR02391 family protein [Candidatus Cloacimonadota bacterium]
MNKIQPFSVEIIESLSKVLGNILSNSEIDKVLVDSKIDNIDPTNTKWRRLYNSFVTFQNKQQCSNNILTFIEKTITPVRFVNNRVLFEENRIELNKVLIFVGITIGENGKLFKTQKAETIKDAEKRAGDLKQVLKDRNVHPDVIAFCKAELLQENYFHAVFEATKSLAEKIRVKTGLIEDGAYLIDKAFGLGQDNKPLLAFSQLETESEINEHRGFMNLLKGVFGMFRNTTAHAPKIKWAINEIDALDSLTIISLLHRKLDNCFRV